MVICMVTNMIPTRDDPGFGVFIKSQIDSIAAAGHEVTTLAIDGRASKKNYFRAVKQLNAILAAKKHDIVHAHYGLSGIPACVQRHCPVVVSFCGDDLLGTSNGKGDYTFKGRLTVLAGQFVAHHADAVIVKSDKMLERLSSASARAKTVVIPNGVDFELFRPIDRLEARKKLGLEPFKKYVLFAGSPEAPVKRFDLADKAVELLRGSFTDVEIIVLHRKPQAEVPVYMNACDVVILTSDSEGSPNVIKEAMACNTPIVSVDAGDAWQLIGGAEQCHRAEREPGDLASKVKRVLQAAEPSDGRRRIGHLELSAVATRVIAVYEAVLAESRRRMRPGP
jgi:glycosyltransferase involved in cell wall biosynthesis